MIVVHHGSVPCKHRFTRFGGHTIIKIKRLFTILLAALLLLSLGACAQGLSVAPANTPTPEATAAPTATPTSEPTPVLTLSPEEEKDVLNQQFQDFLNKEGEFSEEKMNYLPIYPQERNAGDKIDLGILRIHDSKFDNYFSAVYGYLFDVSISDDNNIILVMGFDGKNNDRFMGAC